MMLTTLEYSNDSEKVQRVQRLLFTDGDVWHMDLGLGGSQSRSVL